MILRSRGQRKGISFIDEKTMADDALMSHQPQHDDGSVWDGE